MLHYQVKEPADAIMYLIDCSLATVEYMVTLKKRPKHEFERQVAIAQQAINWMTEFGIDHKHTRAENVMTCDGSVSKWAGVSVGPGAEPSRTRGPDSEDDVIVYLVDCTLATIAHQAMLRSRNRSEYKRQCMIAQRGVDFMRNMDIDPKQTRAKKVIDGGGLVQVWASHYLAS